MQTQNYKSTKRKTTNSLKRCKLYNIKYESVDQRKCHQGILRISYIIFWPREIRYKMCFTSITVICYSEEPVFCNSLVIKSVKDVPIRFLKMLLYFNIEIRLLLSFISPWANQCTQERKLIYIWMISSRCITPLWWINTMITWIRRICENED